MAKVIQIRGVSDDVHAKLVAAADAAGTSLTSYLSDALEVLARRGDAVEHNRAVLERLRTEIGTIAVPDGETVRVIRQAREDRTGELLARLGTPRG